MFVIKPGKSKEHDCAVRFNCELCGCEFLAFDDEFEIRYNTFQGAGVYSKDAYAKCPTCGATVITYDVEG